MIPVKVLAVRYLSNASEALCAALGVPPGYPALGMLTTVRLASGMPRRGL